MFGPCRIVQPSKENFEPLEEAEALKGDKLPFQQSFTGSEISTVKMLRTFPNFRSSFSFSRFSVSDQRRGFCLFFSVGSTEPFTEPDSVKDKLSPILPNKIASLATKFLHNKHRGFKFDASTESENQPSGKKEQGHQATLPSSLAISKSGIKSKFATRTPPTVTDMDSAEVSSLDWTDENLGVDTAKRDSITDESSPQRDVACTATLQTDKATFEDAAEASGVVRKSSDPVGGSSRKVKDIGKLV